MLTTEQWQRLYRQIDSVDLRSMLEVRVKGDPDGIAFVYGVGDDRTEKSCSQFLGDVLALASHLHDRYQHEKIALIGENSYEWIVGFFATIISDNVVVPLDKDLPVADLDELVERCGCALLVHSRTYADVAEALGEGRALETLSMADVAEMLAGRGEVEFAHRRDPDDVCAIFFTSGTTGRPKGVMLSERNISHDSYYSIFDLWLEGDSVLTLPLHHTFSLAVGVIGAYVCGHAIYISRGLRHFAADLVRHRPASLCVVPLYLETLHKRIWQQAKADGREARLRRALRLSRVLRRLGIDVRRRLFGQIHEGLGGRLTDVICGGAYLDQDYVDFFGDIGINIYNGYGITECSPIVSVNRAEKSVAHSVGRPVSCLEVATLGGEICVRGDAVMLGYYDDAAATREALADGWFHTGDLGYVSDDGYVFITGRKKNLIILSNGKNVSAEELEGRLARIDGVSEVVVTGEGDRIVAEVYSKEGRTVDADVKELNRRLPPYKRIAEVRYRDDEFPKTTTQKIKR